MIIRHAFFLAFTLLPVTIPATTRVLYLPFEDKVRLKEAWKLDVDVPRWFSETVDTIGGNDTLLSGVNFDSTLAMIAENRLKSSDYLDPLVLQRIGARFDAPFAVRGRVDVFRVVKRAINTDAAMGGSHAVGTAAIGQGGATVMGGLQTYKATIRMSLDIYSTRSGAILQNLVFDSEEKDGGLKVWLPTNMETDEMIFHYLSRSPFGSEYFHKSVVGALMKNFSERLYNDLVSLLPQATAPAGLEKEYIEGKILERTGSDAYINLGIKDNLFLGEEFEVLKPVRPVLDDNGDTLGWVEQPIGLVTVRSLKSHHFSRVTIVEESDSITAGLTVRIRLKNEKGENERPDQAP